MVPNPYPTIVTPGDLGDELIAFIRSLRADNKAPNTIDAYGGAVVTYARWAMRHDLPTDIASITRMHVETWIADILDTRKPSTAKQRYSGLKQFFEWYAGADNDFRSPMADMTPPYVPEVESRVFSIQDVKDILAACGDGSSFVSKRNIAIVRMLFNTGSRRAEISRLRYSMTDPLDRDIDLRNETVRTYEKGRKGNLIGLDSRTLVAIEEYLRVRKKHRFAAEPWLWLGQKGRLTDSGVAQMLERIGRRVGVRNLHAHDFRHTATHHDLADGISESDVMMKRGWSSPAMLRRYARSTGQVRSIAAYKKAAIGDRI